MNKEDKKKREEFKRNELKKLGKTIQNLSENLYETQTEFSVAAECTPEYLNRVMKGKQNPGYVNLIKIADALNVSLDELRKGKN